MLHRGDLTTRATNDGLFVSGIFIATSASIVTLDRIFMRLVPFVLVLLAYLPVVTRGPVLSIGPHHIVHAR